MSTVSNVLLGTAIVAVSSGQGQCAYARALIDPFSEASLIAESLVHRLKLKRDSNKIPVTGVGYAVSIIRGAVTMVICSRLVDDWSIEVEAFVLPKVTSYKPKFTKSLCD